MQNINTLRTVTGYHIVAGAERFDWLLAVRCLYHCSSREAMVKEVYRLVGERAVGELLVEVLAALVDEVRGPARDVDGPGAQLLDLLADSDALVAALDVRPAEPLDFLDGLGFGAVGPYGRRGACCEGAQGRSYLRVRHAGLPEHLVRVDLAASGVHTRPDHRRGVVREAEVKAP